MIEINMKKTILNLLLFLACMSSCSKNDSFEKTEELSNPVTVSFMTNISRVTGSSWEDNDSVGISATGTDVTYTNVKYLSDASGKFTVSEGVQPICFKNTNPMSFTAYYPYSDNNGTVSVNTLENNSDCNFIWAKADNVQYSETPTVNLQFDHSMAELRIVVSAQDGASLESFKNMTVSGLKHDGNFTTADGKAAVLADAQPKDWDILLTEANGKLEFKGYVLPQAISDLSIRVNSASHNIIFDNNSFEEGLYYTINVTVNSDNTVNVKTTIFGTTINGQYDASNAKIGSRQVVDWHLSYPRELEPVVKNGENHYQFFIRATAEGEDTGAGNQDVNNAYYVQSAFEMINKKEADANKTVLYLDFNYVRGIDQTTNKPIWASTTVMYYVMATED